MAFNLKKMIEREGPNIDPFFMSEDQLDALDTEILAEKAEERRVRDEQEREVKHQQRLTRRRFLYSLKHV